MSWERVGGERPLDRVAENEIYLELVRRHPKRDDENAVEYAGRIADLAGLVMRGELKLYPEAS